MRRRSRRLVIVLAAIALVVVAARLALDPYATWRTRRVLAGLEGMDARFSDVTVSVLELSYEIRDLRIEKRAGAGRALPFFEARRIRFGVLGVSVRFTAVDGELTGGIRPILKDAGSRPAKPGLGARLKSFLADASLHIFKDDVPGREAVATTIPIAGRVDDPDLQLVPTILGVVRNAFVRGLSDSLQGLPPPKAKEPEGVVHQARRALTPGRGQQPRAQPEPGGK